MTLCETYTARSVVGRGVRDLPRDGLPIVGHAGPFGARSCVNGGDR
jgi:hypothetical protein